MLLAGSPRAAAVGAVLVALAAGAAACSDDASDVDAAVDAPIDTPVDVPIDTPMGTCGADVLLTGEYVDWDSTTTVFDGVEEAVWTVVSEPSRHATTAPNGRIILCLAPTTPVTISVETPTGPYIAATFAADPAVFAPPGTVFSIRGLKDALKDARYATIDAGLTFDPAKAQVMVAKLGTPIPFTLTGAGQSYAVDGEDDQTWAPADQGFLVLFPNVDVAAPATLSSTSSFTGPTSIPVTAGQFTFVVVR